MQIRFAGATIALAVGSLLIAKTVAATTFTSSDVLRVSFTTNPTFGGNIPDTLEYYFFPGGISSVGVTGYGAELYDGGTLLGTYHANSALSGFIVPLFKSAASPVTLLNPTIVDFTKVLNGTIAGRIDFHLDSGSATFTALNNILWDATLADGGGVASPGWTTYNLQVVPEPASVLLLGTGLIGAGIRRYRRHQ